MDIKVSSSRLIKSKAQAIVITFFEDDIKLTSEILDLDKIIGGVISRSFKQKRLTGKLGESELFHSLAATPANLVVVMGLGRKTELTTDKLRKAFASLCRTLRQNKASSIAIQTQGISIPDAKLLDIAQALVEGSVLGLYRFRKHITKKADYDDPLEMTLICSATDAPMVKSGVETGRILAGAGILARDMVNEPGNFMTPTDIASTAREIASKFGMALNILEKDEMAELGMGGVLGVSQIGRAHV